MEKNLMIDYRNDEDMICRKVIDDMEFCVRGQNVYFVSNGQRYNILLENVIQVYTTDT